MSIRAATVEAGEIEVGEIDLVLDTDRARAWHVDVASKYAEVFGLGGREVLLGATDRTLSVNEARRGMLTKIGLDVPEGWTLIAECARYTCRVVAYLPGDPITT